MIDELLEFVRRELKLGERQKDGATMRDHLESIQRQTGVTDPLLLPVACPDEAKYLYEDYFLSMNRRRTNNGYGPNALGHADIHTWAQLHGVRLAPFEVEALDRIETLYLEHCHRVMKNATPS